jgi:hypothetical protein
MLITTSLGEANALVLHRCAQVHVAQNEGRLAVPQGQAAVVTSGLTLNDWLPASSAGGTTLVMRITRARQRECTDGFATSGWRIIFLRCGLGGKREAPDHFPSWRGLIGQGVPAKRRARLSGVAFPPRRRVVEGRGRARRE